MLISVIGSNPSFVTILALFIKFTLLQHKEGEDSVSHSKGAELLFTHATLQLFSNGEEAADVLKVCLNYLQLRKSCFLNFQGFLF